MSDRTHRLLLFGVSSMLHAAALLSLAAVPCPPKKVRPIEVALLELPDAAEHGRIAQPTWQEEKARPEAGKSAHGAVRREKPETREGAAESAARSTEQSLARPLPSESMPPAATGGGGQSGTSASPGNALRAGGGQAGEDDSAQPGTGDHGLSQYLRLVRERIGRYKKYPLIAKKRELEGQVGIRFLLTGAGEARLLAVSRSSGQEILDNAALRAVQDGAPFPPPPTGLLTEPITIELNIVFNLS